jgi:hypothetical protein
MIVGAVVVAGVFAGVRWASERDPGFRDPVYAAKRQMLTRAIRETGDHQPLVAIGSSRLDFGFRAADIEGATGRLTFNFGVAGGGPLMTATNVDRLIASGIRPRALLIEVMPSMLHSRDHWTYEANLYPPSRFTIRERATWHSYGARSDLWDKDPTGMGQVKSLILVRSFPWLIDRPRWHSLVVNGDSRGWNGTIFQSRTAEQRLGDMNRTRQEHRPSLAELEIEGGAAEALRDLLSRFRDRPVRLILLPESTEFRTFYGPGANDRLMAYLGTLAAPLIDARDWVPDDQFKDGHHLLPSGAVTFTTRLLAEHRAFLAGESP